QLLALILLHRMTGKCVAAIGGIYGGQFGRRSLLLSSSIISPAPLGTVIPSAAGAAPPRAPRPPSLRGRILGASRRDVLIVDDEDASREALCELLRSEGYAPATARDGAAALDRLQSFPFPLLISELETQRLGALDLLHAIEHRHLPTALVVL